MRNRLINKYNKLKARLKQNIGSEKFQEAWSIFKEIIVYGFIGYPAYHLLIVRENIIINIIGCGSLYFMFKDVMDFIITQLDRMRRTR